MNNTEKLAKLKALKESYAATQKKLSTAKKIEESLHPTNISKLFEAELEQAEVILAAKDFATKLQKMAEDLAKMQADSIPLGDNMKDIFGPEAATDFETTVTKAITDGLVAVRGAKDQISSSIDRVDDGTATAGADASLDSDMAVDPFASDNGSTGDIGGDDLGADTGDLNDVFGGAEASSGPVDEPLGRGMKESYKVIGRKLLVKESLDSLVNWLFEDIAATMPAEQFPKFAGQIAMKGAQDSERLAGWIGKRKYGQGLGAQLSSPLADMDDDILDEGKSYKKNDEDGDAKDKKKASMQKSAASKSKRDIEEGKKEEDDFVSRQEKKKLDSMKEGKSYKFDSDEDSDTKDKKKNSVTKSEKAKDKRTVEEAVRLIIERNILQTGKGFAARAIAEAQSMFPMVEGTTESISEAFEAEYGMSPQAYSVKKARIVAEAAPLNPQDKKNAAGAMGAIASKMNTDKNMGNKPASTAMSQMDPTQRTTAQKVINKAKAEGKPVQKVSDLVDATNAELAENINAANWPVNSMGQYKGEPFQTDHAKLAPNKTKSDNKAVSDAPKGADTPKSSTPWDGESKAKAESPKTSDGKTASTKPAAPSQDGVKKTQSQAPKKESAAPAETSEEKDED